MFSSIVLSFRLAPAVSWQPLTSKMRVALVNLVNSMPEVLVAVARQHYGNRPG
jgi:hypothetical protein